MMLALAKRSGNAEPIRIREDTNAKYVRRDSLKILHLFSIKKAVDMILFIPS
jgi:hypothetical protein